MSFGQIFGIIFTAIGLAGGFLFFCFLMVGVFKGMCESIKKQKNKHTELGDMKK